MTDNKKLLCIVGPTASGKTDLAFDISHVIPGELVNADSKQVYRGIDIIPGKDIHDSAVFVESELDSKNPHTIGFYSCNDVRLWLLDIVAPQNEFTVSEYVTIAPKVVDYIHVQNRTPVLVGGSGMYINAFLNGIETANIPQNTVLREELENKDVSNLQQLLKSKDLQKFNGMNNSDINNKRRLIRAIEIANFKMNNEHEKGYDGFKGDIKIIGLFADRKIIKDRIDERVQARIKQGAFEEIERIYTSKETLSNTFLTMNGVMPILDYFDNRITKDEAIGKWKLSEYLNAKKQMTWFQKDKRIEWFDIEDIDYKQKTILSVKNWYYQ